MMTRRKKKTLFDELHSFSDVYDVCVKWKHRYLREEVVQPQFKRKTRFTRTRNVLLKQNVVTDRQLLFRIKEEDSFSCDPAFLRFSRVQTDLKNIDL